MWKLPSQNDQNDKTHDVLWTAPNVLTMMATVHLPVWKAPSVIRSLRQKPWWGRSIILLPTYINPPLKTVVMLMMKMIKVSRNKRSLRAKHGCPSSSIRVRVIIMIMIMMIFMWLKINYPLQIAQALAGDSDSESPSLTCSSDFRLLAIMGGLPWCWCRCPIWGSIKLITALLFAITSFLVFEHSLHVTFSVCWRFIFLWRIHGHRKLHNDPTIKSQAIVLLILAMSGMISSDEVYLNF